MGKSKNIVETKSTKEKMKKNDNIPISSKISLFMYIYSMGVNMLMPLNILFCAYSYYVKHKLKMIDQSVPKNVYQTYYISYVAICLQTLATITAAINNFTKLFNKISLKKRILISSIASILFSVFSLILAIIDTSQYVLTFFILTMISAFIVNGFTSVLQCCAFGFIGCLHPQYINAFSMGMNTSGVIGILIVMLATAVIQLKYSGILIYGFSLVLSIWSIVSFILIPKNLSYKYQKAKNDNIDDIELKKLNVEKDNQDDINKNSPSFQQATLTIVDENIEENSAHSPKTIREYIYIIRINWTIYGALFITFLITFNIFPGLLDQITPSTKSISKNNAYFKGLIVFLNFNVFAVIGSVVASFATLKSGFLLLIISIIRIGALPLTFFFNMNNATVRLIPVYIKSDIAFGIFVALLAFSNGYLVSCCMMELPNKIKNKLKGISVMMGALCIFISIWISLCFAFLYNYLSYLEA